MLNQVAALELIQAPGLPYSIPKEFEKFPRLTGNSCLAIAWLSSAVAMSLCFLPAD